MRRIALLTALLALGCATPIQTRSWVRVETPHFHLISGAGEQVSIQTAQWLEFFRAVLERHGVEMQLEPRVPLLVYLFGQADAFERFRPRSGLAGFMLPRAHRSFLAVDASGEMDAQAVALHEYVHFFLRNGEAIHYPTWYDEGMAEMLSTLSVEDGKVFVGRIPAVRAPWLLYGSPLSLRRVMTAQDAYEWSDRALARFYAQAWAVTHFLHFADRVGFPKRHRQMLRYVDLLNREVTPDAACLEAFGTDFEGLEKEFLVYLGEGSLPYVGFPLSQLEVPDEHRVTPLPEHEKRYLLGDLALALGAEWRDEAELWFRLSIQSRPEDGRAHAALGRVQARSNHGDADAHFAQALAMADGDPEVHRLYGESLLERAETTSADEALRLAEEARWHFRRSIELDREQVAAYAGLGRSFLVAPSRDDPLEGLEALETAHGRLPADRSISLALAEFELQFGANKRARSLLAGLPPPSHGDPVVAVERLAVQDARRRAGLPTEAPRAARHLVTRLDVDSPKQGERVRGLSEWIEVRGRGGLWESTRHDLVIAIDESASTLLPTGMDLDGDGLVGRERRPRGMDPDRACTDPDDTVIRAELEAAHALIRQLDARTTRVAVVTFAGGATVRAPLGTPESALLALADYEVHVDRSGTSLANALAKALEEFFQHREVGVRRQRTILLLSDGQPTVPSERHGKRDAVELADLLGGLGVPVQAFALGENALKEPDFYRSLAERSGGKFVPVENPAEVVSHLASVRFTGLEEVAIRSLPAGKPGRAVRVFPEGSFDAYVPLVEGKNVIEITAIMEGGRTLETSRTVLFERPAEPEPEDERQAARLRAKLEMRALEVELLAEIRGRREPAGSRHLEIEVEKEDGAAEP